MFFCMDLWFRTWSHHWVFYRNPRKARGKTVIWQSRTLPSLLRELPTRSYYFSASFPHCQTILVDLSLYKWKENDCSFSKNYDLGTNTKNEKKNKNAHTEIYDLCLENNYKDWMHALHDRGSDPYLYTTSQYQQEKHLKCWVEAELGVVPAYFSVCLATVLSPNKHALLLT